MGNTFEGIYMCIYIIYIYICIYIYIYIYKINSNFHSPDYPILLYIILGDTRGFACVLRKYHYHNLN